MNFFRHLTADMPSELLAAQVTAADRPVETTIEPAAWIPAPEYPEIWAALAAVGNSPGVIDRTTHGFPVQAAPAGEN